MIAWVEGALAAPSGSASVEARAITTLPSEFPLDAEGTEAGWGPALDTRLRLGVEGALGAARTELELDVLSGVLAGETWELSSLDERVRDRRDAATLDGLVPRKLLVGGRLPWFDLEVGLTTSQWGLGMLANNGASEPVFGRTDFGDRVIRARLATQPFGKSLDDRAPIYLVVAGDRVIADDLARSSEGDVAWQGLAALVFAPDGLDVDFVRQLGLYGVWRDQTSADGRRTTAAVADLTGHWRVQVREAWFEFGWEGAFIGGRTDVARTYSAPESVLLSSGGAVAEAMLATDRGAGGLRFAWASGDSTSDDDRVTDFRFDRDYDVGMVLFEEVAAAVDLQAYTLASDPSRAAIPPEGVETLVAEGAFHAAAALQPVFRHELVSGVSVAVGAVAAWSTSPIAHPYYSFRAGGVPTNAGDVPAEGRWLGSEFDWSATASAPDAWIVRPEIRVQGGHAWPAEGYLPGAGRVDHFVITLFGRY